MQPWSSDAEHRCVGVVVVAAMLLALLLVPTSSAAAAAAAAAAEEPPLPPVDTDVDYQLGGAVDPPDHVGIVVRDRTEEPVGDRYDVCYVNGFQTQPDAKRFWRDRWHLVLKKRGRPVVDSVWGEWLLDVRTRAKRKALAGIMGRWAQGCADDGFDAVEYDNLDSFTRSHRLVTRRHALNYARMLVRRGHDADLAVGQKNLANYDGTQIGYDFAVAESCGRYDECGAYVDHYDRAVLAIEYRRADFEATCEEVGEELAVVLRDSALSPDGVREWC